MSDVLVRGVDPAVLEKIKTKAKRHHRSLQSELIMIINGASVEPDPESALAIARAIRMSVSTPQRTDSAELLRGDRDR